MRKDLLTNTMQPKKELVRVVVDKDKNISVDPTGKKSGRGAYVSPGHFCIGKTPDFHLLSSKMGASTSDAVIRGWRSHSFFVLAASQSISHPLTAWRAGFSALGRS